MPESLRLRLLSLRDLLVSAGPLVLLTLLLLSLAYWWLDPNPPRRVTLATGPAQSAYAEFGQRYRKAQAAQGIDVVLLASEGSSDNLQLLQEGRADLGFVQGGSAARSETEGSDPPVSLAERSRGPAFCLHPRPFSSAHGGSDPQGRRGALGRP